MTHDLVDGLRVGQHPIAIRFLRGIFNSHPPAPKYTTTWDVDRVLIYIHNLLENGPLLLAILSHELAMIFAQSNVDRCSELASLDLRFRSYLRSLLYQVLPRQEDQVHQRRYSILIQRMRSFVQPKP